MKANYCKKLEKIWTSKKCCNYPKILIAWFCRTEMCPKDAEVGMANSVDPDQTAPAVRIGSTAVAQTCLSKNLGSLWLSRQTGTAQ